MFLRRDKAYLTYCIVSAKSYNTAVYTLSHLRTSSVVASVNRKFSPINAWNTKIPMAKRVIYPEYQRIKNICIFNRKMRTVCNVISPSPARSSNIRPAFSSFWVMTISRQIQGELPLSQTVLLYLWLIGQTFPAYEEELFVNLRTIRHIFSQPAGIFRPTLATTTVQW